MNFKLPLWCATVVSLLSFAKATETGTQLSVPFERWIDSLFDGHGLYVLHPHKLARNFEFNGKTNKGLIRSSVGQFGVYDQHGVFQGRVHYPMFNQDGCKKFNESDFNAEHLKQASFDGHKAIIMVDRGTCHFVKKVQNIQKFGAIMAIIIDSNDLSWQHMSDDGQGSSIRIPSFMIGKKDGDKLKETIHNLTLDQFDSAREKLRDILDNHQSGDFQDPRRFRAWSTNEWANRSKYFKKGHQVILQGVIGGKIGKSNTVNVDLWYDSAYELFTAGWNLKEMAKMSDLFHKKANVKFQPRTMFTVGKQKPLLMQDPKCINNGKYCLDMGDDFYKLLASNDTEEEMKPYMTAQGQAEQIIKEQCVFKALRGEKSHWFRFMDILINGCVKQKNVNIDKKVKIIKPECFVHAMKFSQIYSNYDQTKFKECYKEQMHELEVNQLDKYDSPKSKSFFDRDYNARQKISIHFKPSITINGEVFEGDFKNTNELFKIICSKIQDRPEACKAKGLSDDKERINQDYEQEWGAKNSSEHTEIVMNKLQKEQNRVQNSLEVQDRNTTNIDLLIVVIVLALATITAFYCKNYRDKAKAEQQMHDAVNQQVSQYFHMANNKQYEEEHK